MGLTIHYGLRFAGSRGDALAKISQLRQKALDMPFETVSEIRHFSGIECDYQKSSEEWRWPLIQAQRHVDLSGGRGYISAGVPPIEAIMFQTWPGEGCEEANLGLCRYPASITHDGKVVSTRAGRSWHWHSFCKTQYANEKGIFHFLKCHTLVAAMLDQAKELGILKEVHDEGHYWENRDLKALTEEIVQWDEFIAGFTAQLNEATGGNLVSEITNHPRYEELKEKGMRHLNEAGLAQLKQLFEATRKLGEQK